MAGHYMGWGIEKEGWRKGPWTAEEDGLLIQYVRLHGEGRWNSVARVAGLKRNGKSCRLRWVNYLRPELKKGHITPHEERIILDLHARWGNRWSTIARSLPGRTDNEIKNYWRTHFKKKAKAPSDAAEKARTRILRRQQFHNQQQQKQQLQVNQADMKRIMAFLDENDSKTPLFWPQVKQDCQHMDTITTYPNHTTDQEQGFFSSMLSNVSAVPEASNDYVLWDGSWNLNDVHGSFNKSSSCASGKASWHNLGVHFC